MQVLIVSGKGKKNRYVNLPQTILKELRAYYKWYHPKEYIFEGQYNSLQTTQIYTHVSRSALEKVKSPPDQISMQK